MEDKNETETPLTPEQPGAISDEYLTTIISILPGVSNETVDPTSPLLRSSMENIYPLVIAMYLLLVAAGTLTNGRMIYHIVRRKLYRDPTYAYLINIAISDLMQCLVVLPITLTALLVRNWIFGKFMCYFLPMLQAIPIHVSMMTYVRIAVDRYRFLSNPGGSRNPACVGALRAWFLAVCIVLPHFIYTTYRDLEKYSKEHLGGAIICMTNLTDNINWYMIGWFLITYIPPLVIAVYIYIKASRELQRQERPLAMVEARTEDSNSRQGSNTSSDVPSLQDGQRESVSIGMNVTTRFSSFSHTSDLRDGELDVSKEKRTQKYLIFMVASFAILVCPLMILKLVCLLALVDTYENTGKIDITFTILVWIAFASSVTTPVLYASWQMWSCTGTLVGAAHGASICTTSANIGPVYNFRRGNTVVDVNIYRPTMRRLRRYFYRSRRRPTNAAEDAARFRLREIPRRGRHVANVAYTRNTRIESITGSNGIGGIPCGSPGWHSHVIRPKRTPRTNRVP